MNTLRVIINTANTEPETLECGCVFTPNRGLVHFRYCHLHLAAADLLAALEDAAFDAHLASCRNKQRGVSFSQCEYDPCSRRRAAIARAEEKR